MMKNVFIYLNAKEMEMFPVNIYRKHFHFRSIEVNKYAFIILYIINVYLTSILTLITYLNFNLDTNYILVNLLDRHLSGA